MGVNALNNQVGKNKVWAAGGIALSAQSANPISEGDVGIYADASQVIHIVYSDGTTRQLTSASLWDPVRVATAAVLPNTPTYSTTTKAYTAGSSVSLNTAGIDGVTDLAVGDRILVKDQATGSRNGIYEVTDLGSGSTPWIITRTSDANSSEQFATGKLVAVSEGSTNADSIFMLSTNAPITLDSTSLTFAAAPLSITYGAAGDMATNGVAAANSAGVANKVSRADHVHAFATDMVATKEVDHVIYTAATTTSATAGGAMTLRGGVGKTSGTGGAVSLTGGAADTTGTGGAANVTGGAGGSVSGAGGAVAIAGGAGTLNANGGAVTIRGGAKNGSGTNGTVTVGDSGTSAITIGASGIITTFNGPQASGASANTIADPGTGQAIPVTRSGVCAITIASAGAETNSLADPTFMGQRITIVADTVGTGTRAVTAASAINGAGNTIMTFNAVRDQIDLIAITVGGALKWAVLLNISVALS